MLIHNIIAVKTDAFLQLCINHNVKYLYAFGSSTTNQFDEANSDIDLLVEIDDKDPLERGEKLLSLWDTFEKFFNRKVDLLTESSITNPYLKKDIDSTKVLIYEGQGQKVLI